MSHNTLPQPPEIRQVARNFQSGDDPRLHYGSVERPGPKPDLQSATRLPPRRDSFSESHNERLGKAVDTGIAAQQVHPNGTVRMEPHVKASFRLFNAQRKEFETNPAYAHIPDRKHTELANFFGIDPADPKGRRVIALGDGPGPGGSYIGHAHAVNVPAPTDPRILMVVHDHNHGGKPFFSRLDFLAASKDGAAHGVPTYGLVNRDPSRPGQGETFMLTNGRIATVAPGGKPTLLDRPEQFQALDNPNTFVNRPANDLRSIAFGVIGGNRPKGA